MATDKAGSALLEAYPRFIRHFAIIHSSAHGVDATVRNALVYLSWPCGDRFAPFHYLLHLLPMDAKYPPFSATILQSLIYLSLFTAD